MFCYLSKFSPVPSSQFLISNPQSSISKTQFSFVNFQSSIPNRQILNFSDWSKNCFETKNKQATKLCIFSRVLLLRQLWIVSYHKVPQIISVMKTNMAVLLSLRQNVNQYSLVPNRRVYSFIWHPRVVNI